MKNIISLLLMFFLFNSCKGQDKEEKQNKDSTKIETYFAKCGKEYSTGENTSDKEKKWSLSKEQIDDILDLSTEITEDELHFSYPVTPCNIDVDNIFYKGKKYDIKINGGSYLSLFDGAKTVILGCDSPDCNKYFLHPKENMEEESFSETSGNVDEKIYKIDFDKNKTTDLLIIRKQNSHFEIEAKIDNQFFFNKNFICDFIEIDTNTKYNQAFNLTLGYTDQYQKTFRKIVIPVFYKNKNLFIEKIFSSSLGTSAKTGKEEWMNKEIDKKISLKNVNLDLIISQ